MRLKGSLLLKFSKNLECVCVFGLRPKTLERMGKGLSLPYLHRIFVGMIQTS